MRLTIIAVVLCVTLWSTTADVAHLKTKARLVGRLASKIKHHKRGILSPVPPFKLGYDVPVVTHSVVKPLVVSYPPTALTAAVKVPLSNPLVPRHPVHIGHKVPLHHHHHYAARFPHTKTVLFPKPDHHFHHHHHHVEPRPVVPVVPAEPVPAPVPTTPLVPVGQPTTTIAHPIPAPSPNVLVQPAPAVPAPVFPPAPLPAPASFLSSNHVHLRPLLPAPLPPAPLPPTPLASPLFPFGGPVPYILRPGNSVQTSFFATFPRYALNYQTPYVPVGPAPTGPALFERPQVPLHLLPQGGAHDGVVIEGHPGVHLEQPHTLLHHQVIPQPAIVQPEVHVHPDHHVAPGPELHLHTLQPGNPNVHLQRGQPELHFQPGFQHGHEVHVHGQPEIHLQPGQPAHTDVHLQPAHPDIHAHTAQPGIFLQSPLPDVHLQPNQHDFHLQGQPGIQLQPGQPEVHVHTAQPGFLQPGQPDVHFHGQAGQPDIHLQPGQPDLHFQPGQPEFHVHAGQPDIHLQGGHPGFLQPGQPDNHLEPGQPQFHFHAGQPDIHLQGGGGQPGLVQPGQPDFHFPGQGGQPDIHLQPDYHFQGGQPGLIQPGQPDVHSQPGYNFQPGQPSFNIQPTLPGPVDNNGWSPVPPQHDLSPTQQPDFLQDNHQFTQDQGNQFDQHGEDQYHDYQHQLQHHIQTQIDQAQFNNNHFNQGVPNQEYGTPNQNFGGQQDFSQNDFNLQQPSNEYGVPQAEGRSSSEDGESKLFHNHVPLGLQPPITRPLEHFR